MSDIFFVMKIALSLRLAIFTVEWYYDSDGYSQAFSYFESTSQAQKRKLLVLVKRIAEFGKIMDITKFRNEGDDI